MTKTISILFLVLGALALLSVASCGANSSGGNDQPVEDAASNVDAESPEGDSRSPGPDLPGPGEDTSTPQGPVFLADNVIDTNLLAGLLATTVEDDKLVLEFVDEESIPEIGVGTVLFGQAEVAYLRKVEC